MSPPAIEPDQTRYQADPDKLAILLPGGGWYTAARPLLHQARAVLLRHKWTVREVWWTPPRPVSSPPWPDGEEWVAWVAEQATKALAGETAERLLFVGKSLGSLAASLAAERGIPAIWLTPVLIEPALVAALENATAPTMLIGGTADSLWDSAVARRIGHPYLEVPHADHGMETDDDPINSAEILKRVTIEMDSFVARLR